MADIAVAGEEEHAVVRKLEREHETLVVRIADQPLGMKARPGDALAVNTPPALAIMRLRSKIMITEEVDLFCIVDLDLELRVERDRRVRTRLRLRGPEAPKKARSVLPRSSAGSGWPGVVDPIVAAGPST